MTSEDSRYERFVERTQTCWNWTGGKDRHGYGIIYLGDYRRMMVHRWSYSRFIGPIPPKMCVLHSCDNPSCSRPDHLFLGTMKDNTRDMIAKGRDRFGFRDGKPGELHPRHLLTADQVREIRRRREVNGETLLSLAEEFGVAKSHIGNICARRLWKCIP